MNPILVYTTIALAAAGVVSAFIIVVGPRIGRSQREEEPVRHARDRHPQP